MKLIKSFLCMMFISCNGLLWASEVEHRRLDRFERNNLRFNESIARAIDAWNINQEFSDDDKKLNQIMMHTMRTFHVDRLRQFISRKFHNSDDTCRVDKVITGIANYHCTTGVVFNNQYILESDGGSRLFLRRNHRNS